MISFEKTGFFGEIVKYCTQQTGARVYQYLDTKVAFFASSLFKMIPP